MITEKMFDKIYILNLDSAVDRMKTMEKRLEFAEIDNWRRFQAISGEPLSAVWKSLNNPHFANPNYVATSLSHLSIYADIIRNGYQQALILEDDVRIHREYSSLINSLPSGGWDTLHLGYIPLNDDCSMWDYSQIPTSNIRNFFMSKNLWGLFAYGVSKKFCKHMLEVYNESFPMEIDRYLVTKMFPNPDFQNIASSPQLFCHDDGLSSNSHRVETGMIERSVDTRFAKYHDFV